MNLTSLAKDLGTTRQTIYARVKSAGIKLDELRDGDGELTQYGVQVIAALFPNAVKHDVNDAPVLDGDLTASEPDGLHDLTTGDGDEIHALRLENAVLRERLAAAQAALESERAAREREQANADSWRAAREREQANADSWRAAAERSADDARRLLTAASEGTSGLRGFIRRIAGR